MADPIVITDYIGMPTYCGPMYLSEKTLAMLESQPIRPFDIDLSKIKLPTEEMMDIEQVFLPKKTPEQLKAQAASVAARLAAAKAALKADNLKRA
nr:hypothetical protein [Tanacetum cinerariifolium]